MILIDLEVPVMKKKYDFQLDENIPIRDIAVQMRDMICLQEQCGMLGNTNPLTLWESEKKRLLPGNKTALECGVKTGDHLLLI